MESIDATVQRLVEERWDPEVRLQRLLPGAVPGLAAHADAVHLIRETALGALVDLGAGNGSRAVAALESVLEHQYPLDGNPWDGTFKVARGERPPPADAVEWVHYDPNWRQFLGVILAVAIEQYEPQLPVDLAGRIVDAVSKAVDGEPADRIPRWYTNPNLMHAWLQGWVGTRTGRAAVLEQGEARVAAIMARFDTYGDVDEYNSPTYDGIDLMVAGLWLGFAPSPIFRESGRRLLAGIGERVSQLYHPGLVAIAGPYIRSYGFGLDRHVSLLGLWFALAGDRRALPAVLTSETDHIHDLLLWPLCSMVAGVVVPSIELRPVTSIRRHVQTFRTTTAVSVIGPDLMIGVESGRRSTFSRDQYAPLVAHWRTGDEVGWFALMPGGQTDIDVEFGDRPEGRGGSAADALQPVAELSIGGGSAGPPLVRVIRSDVDQSAMAPGDRSVRCGRFEIVFDPAPDVVETHPGFGGSEHRLQWLAAPPPGDVPGVVGIVLDHGETRSRRPEA